MNDDICPYCGYPGPCNCSEVERLRDRLEEYEDLGIQADLRSQVEMLEDRAEKAEAALREAVEYIEGRMATCNFMGIPKSCNDCARCDDCEALALLAILNRAEKGSDE